MKSVKRKKDPNKRKKRDMYEYPALKKNLNLKRRQEEMDCDYLNKLSVEELLWLNKFNKEYINASLDVNNLSKNLHKTKKLKKDCQDRNNDRNACIYTKEKASNRMRYIEELNKHPVSETYEDELIKKLDKLDIDSIKLRIKLKNQSNNSK